MKLIGSHAPLLSLRRVICISGLLIGAAGAAEEPVAQGDPPPPSPEAQFIAEADAYVDSKAEVAAKDPRRPIYHVLPKSQSLGDPNGPVFFNGEYHVFFQHFPFRATGREGIVWGHAVSKDLVHWQHLPIALAPGPAYDTVGIASGGCVIDRGTPTILYTGFNGPGTGQKQCVATSRDGLRTWTKDPANPVLAQQPPVEGLDPDGFRDPFVWREGDEWRLLVGSGYAKEKGGTVLLYRSDDLRQWDFLGPLTDGGMGPQCFMWECPTFFPLGDKRVLIVSPLFRDAPGLRGFTRYAVGTYRDNRFTPGEWQPLDLAGPGTFYAATSFEDEKSRRILWGFLMTPPGPENSWSNCLSLPRLITPGPGGTMLQEPLPELAALRKGEKDCGGKTLKAGSELILAPALGLHGEVALEIDLGKAQQVELRIGRTADGARYVPLSYDKSSSTLTFGDSKAEFKMGADKLLKIRLFTDGAVAEAFINGRACFSAALPVDEKSVGLSIVASGGGARISKGKLWEMGPAW